MADILKGQHLYNKMAAVQYLKNKRVVKMRETVTILSYEAHPAFHLLIGDTSFITSPRVNARDSKLILQR
jgi:hypothetical protein